MDHLINTLGKSRNPYLRQHRNNPIAWQVWEEATFALAKEADKPIFLSIGYATCHWCHVMAHDCFEDKEVALLINEQFIAIKLDREERPDIDHVYMQACQALTGMGGWPLTLVTFPDGTPFFAGTYFPKHGTAKRPGLMTVLSAIVHAWHTQRDTLLETSRTLMAQLRKRPAYLNYSSDTPSDPAHMAMACFKQDFDPTYGGFSKAPKFPMPHQVLFLLRYATVYQDIASRHMALTTLDALRRGGIFDHVAGGFHRYSTDAKWHIPHFEKMLYDQALLLTTYAEAYACTKAPLYKDTLYRLISYLNTHLKAPVPAYYCAEDADTTAGEGIYYSWSYEELCQLIASRDQALFFDIFAIIPTGNYHDEATGMPTGRNILMRSKRPLTLAENKRINTYLETLNKVRLTREKPAIDTKILTDWNGLLLAGLANTARVTADKQVQEKLLECADFFSTHLWHNQTLYHGFHPDTGPYGMATLFDYQYFIYGLLAVYRLVQRATYLDLAITLMTQATRLFWDSDQCSFKLSMDKHLCLQPIDTYDGALPAANAIAYDNLKQLAQYTHQVSYQEHAQQLFRGVEAAMRAYPLGCAHWLSAYVAPLPMVLVSTKKLTKKEKQHLCTTFNGVIQDPDSMSNTLWLKTGFATRQSGFYLCANQQCMPVMTSIAAVIRAIKKLTKSACPEILCQ